MYHTNEAISKRRMEEAFYQQQYPSGAGNLDRFQSSRDVGGINISVNPVILVDCGERRSSSSADTTTTTNPSITEMGSLMSGLAGALIDIFK